MNRAEKYLGDQLTELVAQAQPLLDAHDNEPAQALVNQALALDPGSTLQHPANVMVQVQAALLALRRTDNEASARWALSALAMANALGQPALLAPAHLAVARAHAAVGDHDANLAELEAGWPQAQAGDDLVLRFWYQTGFGIAHTELGQNEQAVEWYRQALATAQALGAAPLVAVGAANLSCTWLDAAQAVEAQADGVAAQQAWHAALDAANEALALTHPTQVARWVAVAVLNRSIALGALGQVDDALAGFEQVHDLLSQGSNPEFIAKTHFNAARVLHRSGEQAAALAELKLGMAVGEACQARAVLVLIYELASSVAEHLGDLAQALAWARRLHALYLEMAVDRAAMRSRLLSVRLETERAQAEADAERRRRIALSEANVALERRAQSLHHEATHDTLTGLPNRRYLDQVLLSAHAHAVLNRQHLCLALLDVDHFKAINDQHSHMVGDEVLRQLGKLLSAASRGGDLAARYGGEEFVVLMGNVTPEQAATVAERLRHSIETFNWASVAPGLRVTASFGVCDIAPAADPVSGLQVADKLMYQAKQQGRNGVVCG
jgi:diguanylate cyclase (GGDEF)-like protein